MQYCFLFLPKRCSMHHLLTDTSCQVPKSLCAWDGMNGGGFCSTAHTWNILVNSCTYQRGDNCPLRTMITMQRDRLHGAVHRACCSLVCMGFNFTVENLAATRMLPVRHSFDVAFSGQSRAAKIVAKLDLERQNIAPSVYRDKQLARSDHLRGSSAVKCRHF